MDPWSDVRFDHGAAVAASEALGHLATQLHRTTERRLDAFEVARADWRGRARGAADRRMAAEQRRAEQVVRRLRRLQAEVEAGADEARTEQWRRVARREEAPATRDPMLQPR